MIIQKIHKMNKKTLTPRKNFMHYLFFALLISTDALHAFYEAEALEEDVQKSKATPLISVEMNRMDILEKGQAVITVYTTPIKGILGCEYDHVYLVFEIQDDRNPKEIDLVSIHFGGDGHSLNVNEGCPIFDSRKDTLIKVHGGKKIDYLESTDRNNLKYKKIEPIYTPKAVFTVTKEKALYALGRAANESNLHYSLSGDPFGIWGENTYNCVTYANKVLKDCGIDTQFDSCYVKNATNFITCCENYKKEQRQIAKKTTEAFCNSRQDRSQKDPKETELQKFPPSRVDVGERSKNDDESSLRKEKDGRSFHPHRSIPMSQPINKISLHSNSIGTCFSNIIFSQIPMVIS